MKVKPVILVILDGFGYAPDGPGNAIALAKKPMFDYLFTHYPSVLLQASGNAVGLPEGVDGNSEVGHTTIGAGRIIPSPFLQIINDIQSGEFFSKPVLVEHLEQLSANGKTLHILGLLSDAGNHCHPHIIFAVIKAAQNHNIKKIVVHAILDGRDVPPQSAAQYLEILEQYTKRYENVVLGSIIGRFYAMDRNNNWDRTQATYITLTNKQTIQFPDWRTALNYYYAHNITDEFIPPLLLDADNIINNGDGVIFANFREDRARQLATCFITPEHVPFALKPMKLSFFISTVSYGTEFNNPVLYIKKPASNTLKELLSKAGKRIFTIAETEKYAHITYFFADGKEQPLEGETRILIPSRAEKKYDQYPQMSAQQITDAVIHSLQTDPYDFYLINYANADMAGHSGNLEATIKAVECLDNQIEQLYKQIIKKMDGTIFITADHGNAEMKLTSTGQPHTGHTTNPVPFIFIKNELYDTKMKLPLSGLSDIASFILRWI